MNRRFMAVLLAASLLGACAVVPAGRHGGVRIVPILPPLVLLDTDPYYFHGGFYYHYDNNAWFYSDSRGGPWTDLPRDHYPQEVRYKGKDGQGDRGRERDRSERGNDYRGR